MLPLMLSGLTGLYQGIQNAEKLRIYSKDFLPKWNA